MKELFMNIVESRVVGGAIAAAGIISLVVLALFGLLPPSTPLAFLVVVLAAYTGGRRVGIAGAVAVGVFSQAMFGHPGGWGQLAVLYACAVAIAYVVGHLRHIYRLAEASAAENKWKVDLVDTINGNLERLQKLHKQAEDLYRGWAVLSDAAREDKVDEIRGGLAALRQLTDGWRAMAEERERVKLAYEREKDV